jgi:hypothetical protein
MSTDHDSRLPLPGNEPRPLAWGPQAALEELTGSALQTYGEERSADARFQAALGVAANALWRVSEEGIDILGDEPLPTHG